MATSAVNPLSPALAGPPGSGTPAGLIGRPAPASPEDASLDPNNGEVPHRRAAPAHDAPLHNNLTAGMPLHMPVLLQLAFDAAGFGARFAPAAAAGTAAAPEAQHGR
jgi:hypothetical protein